MRLISMFMTFISLVSVKVIPVKAGKERDFLDGGLILEIEIHHVILGSQQDNLRWDDWVK